MNAHKSAGSARKVADRQRADSLLCADISQIHLFFFCHRLQGSLHIGGQEHFYLETQISSVMPTEDGGMIVYCSTQNPTEVQKLVAEVLDVSMNKIVVDMRRMGGGFGGKETQAASPARPDQGSPPRPA